MWFFSPPLGKEHCKWYICLDSDALFNYGVHKLAFGRC